MKLPVRLALASVVCVLLALTAHGAGLFQQASAEHRPERPARTEAASGPADPDGPTGTPTPAPAPDPTSEPHPAPTSPAPDPEPAPEPEAGRTVLSSGDESAEVSDLQARLRQLELFDHDVTGFYGEVTAAAVSAFQADRGLPATGEVDRATLRALDDVTTEPTDAELTNVASVNTPGPLDPRCQTGRVLCADKTSRTLRWVVDGEVLMNLDARFGGEPTYATGEGTFHVRFKSRDHVSSIYDAWMPFAMFFNGGEAVHYSPEFVRDGYDGASHGCVNIRDMVSIEQLFDEVRVGDTVVVYRS